MTWIDTYYLKSITGLDNEMEEDEYEVYIQESQRETLMSLNQQVVREKVEYIDTVRSNKIDGENTIYYIENYKDAWLSDSNYDLTVDTSDVEVLSVDYDTDTETSLTISSITPSEGKIVVSSAPENVDLYLNYTYTNIDTITPDPRLKLAVCFLAASYCYLRLAQGGKVDVKFGNTSIKEDYLSNYDKYYTKYLDLIEKINSSSSDGGVLFGYSNIRI